MLEDRDYMRQPVYRESRISCTVAILIANAIVFLIQQASNSPRGLFVQYNYFALSLTGLEHYYVWQLLTFQFMHAGWLHIIFNSLAIFFFGRAVETIIGHARLLMLYFSSGIIGGLVQMLFAFLIPKYFDGAVVGASAGAYGLVAAFAILYWEDQFTLLLFYVIPVTIRGRTLLWASIVAAVFGSFILGGNIASAAHVGGILTGFLYVRQIVQGRWHLPQWKFSSRRRASRDFAAVGPGKKKLGSSSLSPLEEDLSADDFLKNEVDPILDKISAHGIQNLTPRERKILENARAKMTKR